MRLEDQVCSLEMAMRLKELGVRQSSCFMWASLDGTDFRLFNTFQGDGFAAFLVSELGEMLPAEVYSYRRYGNDVEWPYAMAKVGDIRFADNVEFQKTEADARAAMLIHLIENRLLTLPRTEL
jgi:hypothetical protein